MLRHVRGCSVGLLDRRWVSCFGCAVVVHKHNGGIRADGDFACEPIMCFPVAENPAATVNVHNDRQAAVSALRPNNANPHRAGGSDLERGVQD